MNFAVPGTNGKLSDSQIALRQIAPESRIRTVKISAVLPELVQEKKPYVHRKFGAR